MTVRSKKPMNAVNRFAELIADRDLTAGDRAFATARAALADTIACMFAGAAAAVTLNTLQTVRNWGPGDSVIVGHAAGLCPPFAALVNGAAAHAFDYDDCDAPANGHPSAVILPALLALAGEESISGRALLDAYIVGVEVMQRLGEAMNMDHYRRGWLSTLTLGSIAAAAACARLQQADHATAVAAVSLGASMASGLTNQGGHFAKQLHPGIAAKNGVVAASLAANGITASDQVLDGPISIGNTMGEYNARKFAAALAKIGDPWTIEEYGLMTKAYPTCGYSHRAIDAAIDLHPRCKNETANIESIRISIPDYYQDLLIYARPNNAAEAMFSIEYNVAVALSRGSFNLSALGDAALADAKLRRLTETATVTTRKPRDPDIVYDSEDPDTVSVEFRDGRRVDCAVGQPTGSAGKPMSEAACRAKFDDCLAPHKSPAEVSRLWTLIDDTMQLDRLDPLLRELSAQS